MFLKNWVKEPIALIVVTNNLLSTYYEPGIDVGGGKEVNIPAVLRLQI